MEKRKKDGDSGRTTSQQLIGKRLRERRKFRGYKSWEGGGTIEREICCERLSSQGGEKAE